MFKYFSLLFIFSLNFNYLVGQTIVEFNGIDDIISNPERGFYHYTEVNYKNYLLLEPSILEGYKNEGISIVHRIFYLPKDAPIPDRILENIQKDFTIIRRSGLKAMIRFAYFKGTNTPYDDATPEQVLQHIEQLTPVLQTHEDVILVLQAGFIGSWGEWYYTAHFSEQPGVISDQNWSDRWSVVSALLDAMPKSRMIQLRTPYYKRTFFDSTEPLSASDAFNETPIARIGHHNDCFASSYTDVGTYTAQIADEKNYLEKETLYLPMGGETCAVFTPVSDCENSLTELDRFHWSYLNKDYHQGVLQGWESEGCYDEIEKKLGYRYRLTEGVITKSTKPDGQLSINLKLKNDGFANPYNPRIIRFVLRNDSKEYILKTDIEPRLWPLDEIINLSVNAGIPSSITEGNYDLYIHLADPLPSVTNNPDYAIRLANENIWDAETGYNLLLKDISILVTNISDDYLGENFFTNSSNRDISLESSSKLYAGAFNQDIMTYWPTESGELTRVIERKSGNGNFEPIAALSTQINYFLDPNLSNNEVYQYRYYLTDGINISDYSDYVTQEVTDVVAKYPEFTVDANNQDWGIIAPIYTSKAFETVIRVFFSADRLMIIQEGLNPDLTLLLNVDNSVATGTTYENGVKGMDYLIRHDSLYRFNVEWEFISKIDRAENADAVEIGIRFELLEEMEDNRTIYFTGKLVEETEELLTGKVHMRSLPPSTPILEVKNSGAQPESRLVVSWSSCENCIGYVLEKSEDNVNWIVYNEYAANDALIIQDDGLELNKTFYYRIRSYNEVGISAYSDIVSKTTIKIEEPLFVNPDRQMNFYPNPTSDFITVTISNPINTSLRVFDLSGRQVNIPINYSANTLILDLRLLQNGLYFVSTGSKNQIEICRIVKR